MRFEPTNREEVHIVLTLEEATELLEGRSPEIQIWESPVPRLETDTWRHRELRAAIERTRRDSEEPPLPAGRCPWVFPDGKRCRGPRDHDGDCRP